MDLLQTWLILGVPLGVVAALGFVGRSRWRAGIGYAVLLVLVASFLLLPGSEDSPGREISAALVGLVAFAFVATGRGTHTDQEFREHHEDRKRFTTAGPNDG